MKVWVNGALDELARLRISPLDHGLLVGDGVFETLRVYDGVPFALAPPPRAAGVSAPAASASTCPASATLRERRRRGARRRTSSATARLRITVTGGEAPLGSERGDAPTDRDRRGQRARAALPDAPTS